MRQRHQRQKHRKVAPWPDDKPGAEGVAQRARYVGSPEHKSHPSAAGRPAARSDASLCDPNLSNQPEILTGVLRDSIRDGRIGGIFEGDFPKYVWGEVNGQLFEARHINGPQGTYKGYPLEEFERPKGWRDPAPENER
jgi:hypothetical protein